MFRGVIIVVLYHLYHVNHLNATFMEFSKIFFAEISYEIRTNVYDHFPN